MARANPLRLALAALMLAVVSAAGAGPAVAASDATLYWVTVSDTGFDKADLAIRVGSGGRQLHIRRQDEHSVVKRLVEAEQRRLVGRCHRDRHRA